MKTPVEKSWALKLTNEIRSSGTVPDAPPPPPPPAEGFTPQAGFAVSGTFTDGATITIVDSQSRFGSHSLNYAAIGFGTGPIYDSLSVGDAMPQPYVDPVSGNQWIGGSPLRTVQEDGGFRFLRATQGAARMIGYDTGSDFNENEAAFFSRIDRATGTGFNSGGGSTQWKSFRINAALTEDNLDYARDMLYHKRFIYASNPNTADVSRGEITITQAGNNITSYGHAHPAWTNAWTRHDMYLTYGTTDAADGALETFSLRWDGVRHSRVDSAPLRLGTRERWRWMMSQEYVNFVTTATFDMGDWYFCRGNRARFEIANSDNYSTATEAYIQLPTSWAASVAQVRGWKGMLDSFAGKFLFFFGEDNLPVLVGEIT